MNRIFVILALVFAACPQVFGQFGYNYAGLDPRDSLRMDSILKNVDNPSRFIEGFKEYLMSSAKARDDQNANRPEAASQGAYVQRMLYDRIMTDIKKTYAWKPGPLDTLKYKNRKRITPEQNVNIFGWHPYWMQNAYQSYNYQLLTVVSYFSYDISPQSGLPRNNDAISEWKDATIVELAHASGCKVLMTMTLFGGNNVSTFLNADFTLQQVAIDSVIALVLEKQADGVDVDFENIPASCRNQFTYFMNELTRQVKARVPNGMVTLTLPSFDYKKVFDFDNLTNQIDLYIIMGYAFRTELDDTSGPIAPMLAERKEGALDLSNSVDGYLAQGIPPNALLLGLPYYGALWRRDGDKSSFVDYLTYREVRKTFDSLPGGVFRYDEATMSNSFRYVDSSSNATLEAWFDDYRSLGAKYDWVIAKKIGGVGIWALGYDNGHNELWALLDEKFTEITLPAQNKVARTLPQTIRQYSNIILAGVVFILGFLGIGFVVSVFDWRVREMLFQTKAFRIMLFAIFFVSLLALLILTGWLEHTWVKALVLAILGIAIAYSVSKIGFKWRSNLP